MTSVVPFGKYHMVIGSDHWTDGSTGNWDTDCLIGRQRADLLLERRDYGLFSRVMRDMTGKGRWTGVEAGFCQRIAELSTRGMDASK